MFPSTAPRIVQRHPEASPVLSFEEGSLIYGSYCSLWIYIKSKSRWNPKRKRGSAFLCQAGTHGIAPAWSFNTQRPTSSGRPFPSGVLWHFEEPGCRLQLKNPQATLILSSENSYLFPKLPTISTLPKHFPHSVKEHSIIPSQRGL